MSDCDPESGRSSESIARPSTTDLHTITSGSAPIYTPWITSDSVVNISTALLMAAAVSLVSVIINTLTYMAYCSIEKERLSLSELQAFVYFPAIGSILVGAIAWMTFMYSGLSARLMDNGSSFKINFFLWLALVAGSVVDTAVGFFLNDSMLSNPRDHSHTTNWLVSVTLNFAADIVLGAMLACGGAKYIVMALSLVHEFIGEAVQPVIGPGTLFAEGKCLASYCGAMWPKPARSDQTAPLIPREDGCADTSRLLQS